MTSMAEVQQKTAERDNRNRVALIAILILLGYPRVRQLDPKRDAYTLWQLHFDLLEDPIIEDRQKDRNSLELEEVLSIVKAMTPFEREALRQRIGR